MKNVSPGERRPEGTEESPWRKPPSAWSAFTSGRRSADVDELDSIEPAEVLAKLSPSAKGFEAPDSGDSRG